LLAIFELVLFMIVPRNLLIHYHAFYAIQKVHFIITLNLLGSQNEHYNEVAVYEQLRHYQTCPAYIHRIQKKKTKEKTTKVPTNKSSG